MNLPIVLLSISTILTFGLLILILRVKNKKSLYYFSFFAVFDIFLSCAISLIQQYNQQISADTGVIITNTLVTVTSFLPVLLFFVGYVYSKSGAKPKPLFYALFILPLISVVLIWTNDYHHLYFVFFSQINSERIPGVFARIFSPLAIGLDILGLFLLLKSSMKNSGFFSKQSLLIVIGALFPLIVDLAYLSGIYTFPMYFEPISFSFAVLCFVFAIFRFDLLNIVPIALQTIVDHISDSYMVMNENNDLIDYNKPFFENFHHIIKITRKENLKVILNQMESISFVKYDGFMESLDEAIKTKKTVSFENQYISGGFEKTFTVEITPIYTQNAFKGTIILLKDITEQRKSFEMIRQTQVMLIESEHMASLGQLVGGIAHNLKTPIMSISGGLVGLSDLIDEYDESVEDDSITADDHREIAADMRIWIGKMKDYTAYMSDIISTVKGQAVQLTASTTDSFTMKELIKRVDILMNHELKRYGCKLSVQCGIPMSVNVKGEINSFVQVINNLIINSIEAYEGKEGVIEFIISKSEADQMIHFEVKDYGCGMTDETKNKLFKEMITTKAKNGTGLGLYMSYSTITGRFGGKMWFESVYGMGTSFYIMIPAV